jgi:hypothetical protein
MRIKLILLFTGYLCVTSLNSYSQNQYNQWYFGNYAGLDFNTPVPVALTNGSMYSIEGCAVMCDSAGSIMFYTNGGDHNSWSGGVWNRNHALMPNGNLNGYSGCNSTVQSSLIIPDPGNSNLYYLFTLDCFEDTLAGGFRFSVIDMSLDAGNGDVTIKDSLIDTAMCEAMCGIRHANGTDFWVVVHKKGTTEFKSFLVNAAGIQPPVSVFTGIVPQDISLLKANGNSDKICYVEVNGTGLFDFDNSTGMISNYLDLGKYSLSASFAPAGNLLYVLEYSSPMRRIMQYDLTASNIPASYTYIDSLPIFPIAGGMMLGPDCKIYLAIMGSNYLDVINYPDVAGTGCGFTQNAVYLGGRQCENQLPNNIDGLFANQCTSLQVPGAGNTLSFQLYPVPAHNFLLIETPYDKNLHVTLTDICGKQLFTKAFSPGQLKELDVRNLSPGIYFIRILANDRAVIRKFVKE